VSSAISSGITVIVTATLNGASKSASLVLQPGNLPSINALDPASVPPGSPGFTLIVNGSGFTSDAVVQWNGSPLRTTFVSSGQLQAVVSAGMLASAGIAKITVVSFGGISSNGFTFPIESLVPAINAGGIVPLFSSAPIIAPGSWISIFGSNLAPGSVSWSGDFPTSLGGVTVTVDNKPAYLSFVSPEQINLQSPDDASTGTVDVVVSTPSGKARSTVTLSQFAPSFMLFDSTYAAGVILTPGGSGAYGDGGYDLLGPPDRFGYSTRPVASGETLELFGVGFGPTDPLVPAGQTFSGAAPTVSTVSITIGGVPATVLFSGLTGSGLYQFNVTVPTVDSGDQLLQGSVGGVSTPAGIHIAIK
jgi:uncharacterized protein (TIGR03437 family)